MRGVIHAIVHHLRNTQGIGFLHEADSLSVVSVIPPMIPFIVHKGQHESIEGAICVDTSPRSAGDVRSSAFQRVYWRLKSLRLNVVGCAHRLAQTCKCRRERVRSQQLVELESGWLSISYPDFSQVFLHQPTPMGYCVDVCEFVDNNNRNLEVQSGPTPCIKCGLVSGHQVPESLIIAADNSLCAGLLGEAHELGDTQCFLSGSRSVSELTEHGGYNSQMIALRIRIVQ